MVDKNYCMSSYLAFRYIEKDDVDFYEGLHHKNMPVISKEKKNPVRYADEIDKAIKKVFDSLEGRKLGILLSGGMDSAILASYMPGGDAYTFRFLNGQYKKEELERAEFYAEHYGLKLHYVDISWETVKNNLVPVMEAKAAPVHSIEPQLLQGAMQAKRDGIERLVIGESSDLIFGGMDGLLSQDWTFTDFMKRYIFTDPKKVLVMPYDMSYLFERYRNESGGIDFLRFMDDIFSVESSNSYYNAFTVAGIPYTDPYAGMKMANPLDLNRVRNGESKYLIRELFSMKYPGYPVPEKIPMPRPVDKYFEEWDGPKRPEFRKDINIREYTGDQKWQMYCLEKFLDLNEKREQSR